MAQDRIFPGIEHNRLGKVLLCYSRSKRRDPSALLELYSLKLSYTETGSMCIHVDFGGIHSDRPPSSKISFSEFLKNLAPFDCRVYTHLYFYSLDGKDLDNEQDHGLRNQVKDMMRNLHEINDNGFCRVGTLA